METCRSIVAQLADVARMQTPVLARNNRGRNLSAGSYRHIPVFHLGAESRINGERNQRVRGIQSNSDKVNLRHFRHSFNVNDA